MCAKCVQVYAKNLELHVFIRLRGVNVEDEKHQRRQSRLCWHWCFGGWGHHAPVGQQQQHTVAAVGGRGACVAPSKRKTCRVGQGRCNFKCQTRPETAFCPVSQPHSQTGHHDSPQSPQRLRVSDSSPVTRGIALF